MDVILRNIDEALYRRLKAEAALKGYRVSEAVEEAISSWLKSGSKTALTEMDANDAAYAEMKKELLEEHAGEYVAFCSGRFIGAASRLEDAGKLARKEGARRALITKLGDEEPAGGEWLWSSIELSTA